MTGQLHIFDYIGKGGQASRYKFERYEGQRVVLHVTSGQIHGKVAEIEPYYTIVKTDNRGIMIGTPTTMRPEE